uniref:Uncharacterized protein n=1 Tax=Nelumbo nucifera TaxID=4432 RepID=A0A822ZV86_NELNU|nr:TPA_asm: hypothetical protein HUJ06_017192 [Nelumbo nucifera]DAD47256.1 TPA_asm: hypothetical protein HUJ06_017193 [Nelumbo nucifera]
MICSLTSPELHCREGVLVPSVSVRNSDAEGREVFIDRSLASLAD